jgi:NADH dehydrogenase
MGGSGFVGRALAETLQRRGLQVRVLTRDREHSRALWPLPSVECLALDVYDEAALTAALGGCGAVVNLAAILNERGDRGDGFRRAHGDLTARALAAARAARVPRFVQMSGLGAAADAPSHYLRSRAEADALVLTARDSRTAIIRPSVIFGRGDGLFGRFGALTRLLPCLPLARPDARLQPVFVGDVVEALCRVLRDDHLPSQLVLELGGPRVWTLREIVAYTIAASGARCLLLPLPDWLGRLQAEVCEHLPGKPFSRDNWRSLARASVVTGDNGLARLGIVPTPIEAVMPALLRPALRARDYDTLRRRARR